MSRTYRALTTLALSLALVTATTAVAAAAQPAVADQNDRLLRSIEAAQAQRTQAAVEQVRAGERNLATSTAQPSGRVEDQNDRLLRGIEAAQAQRTQAAVEQVRAGERNLGPVPVVTVAAPPLPATDGRGVDVLAIVLLGLAGGLAGGTAAIGAWTLGRRRLHRVVAA
jgi:hypothetical protein